MRIPRTHPYLSQLYLHRNSKAFAGDTLAVVVVLVEVDMGGSVVAVMRVVAANIQVLVMCFGRHCHWRPAVGGPLVGWWVVPRLLGGLLVRHRSRFRVLSLGRHVRLDGGDVLQPVFANLILVVLVRS